MSRQNGLKGEVPLLEFRISREARERYHFEGSLYSISGNVLHSDFYTVQVLVQKMNEKRDLFSRPERTVRAGSLNAMGLISAILHYVSALYRRSINPGSLENAAWLVTPGRVMNRAALYSTGEKEWPKASP